MRSKDPPCSLLYSGREKCRGGREQVAPTPRIKRLYERPPE